MPRIGWGWVIIACHEPLQPANPRKPTHKPFAEVFSNIAGQPNIVLYFAAYFSTVE